MNYSKTPRVKYKKCPDCRKTLRVNRILKLSKFAVRKSTSAGRLTWRYSPRCKTCEWKYKAVKKRHGITYPPCAKLSAAERRIRQLARHSVTSGVWGGYIKKPKACSRCHKKVPRVDLHAHHKDYTQRKNITWVCRWCHNLKDGTFDKPQLRTKYAKVIGCPD